jgi:hypothetical protein
MYNVIVSGTGMKKRMIQRLNLQIAGDRNNPRLFRTISVSFSVAILSLLHETNEMLKTATDKCCEDIGNDLELLRGENVPAVEEDGALETLRTILEHARTSRDDAERVFEAGLGHEAPIGNLYD